MSRHGHELGAAAYRMASVLTQRLCALGVGREEAVRIADGFMTHLMQQGWRPVPVQPAVDWRTKSQGVEPNEDYKAAREALRQEKDER
ncbi:hypothetical protein [Streptomyces sp. NPDC093261]|uniref:hypothetical protein n=1 Tax=Streptomyces sp. NPDC093261 TaxID=3366037 RepID=UPI00381593DD